MIYFGCNEDLAGHERLVAAQGPLRSSIARFGAPYNAINWGHLDAVIPRLEGFGQRPLVTLYGVNSDPDPAEYGQAVASLHARYPRAIVQAWNEPNNPTFGDLSPELAGELMRAAAFASTGRVIGCAASPGKADWQEYTRAAYRDVGLPVALHVYPHTHDPVSEVRSAYAFGEDVAEWRGVWVTELGLQRRYYGANQAALSAQSFRALRGLGASAVIFHRLVEPGDVSEWERAARLWFIRANGERTDLYRALAKERG